jgi:cyanophycin synthetase
LKYKHWRVWTGFGRTRETKTLGTYNVVSVIPKNVGLFAAESAVAIAESLIAGTEYDLESDLQKMRKSGNVFA